MHNSNYFYKTPELAEDSCFLIEDLIDEKLTRQYPQLHMTSTVHVKHEVDPCYILHTIQKLSNEAMLLEKHTTIASLGPHQDSNLKTQITHILVRAKDEGKLSSTPGDTKFICYSTWVACLREDNLGGSQPEPLMAEMFKAL